MRRLSYVSDVVAGLTEHARICRPYPHSPADSPLFFRVIVDTDRINCSEIKFAETVLEEGIELNPHYRFVVDE